MWREEITQRKRLLRIEQLDHMSDLKWPLHQAALMGRIPLHHAHMIAGRKDHRISCRVVKEFKSKQLAELRQRLELLLQYN